MFIFFFFKQKTAYEMRISDWSSRVLFRSMLDSTFLDPHRVCIGLLPVTAFSIVLLAMIAAFLGMRLYSVLGKRTGHEQEPVLPRERAAASPVRLDEGDEIGRAHG